MLLYIVVDLLYFVGIWIGDGDFLLNFGNSLCFVIDFCVLGVVIICDLGVLVGGILLVNFIFFGENVVYFFLNIMLKIIV